MATADRPDATTLVVLVLAAVIAVPVLTMGLGFGGMMGYGGMMGATRTVPTWWPLVGLVVQLAFLGALLAVGYLVVRRLTGSSSSDAAMEELRMAYARGDLTDEEFETRRARLDDAE